MNPESTPATIKHGHYWAFIFTLLLGVFTTVQVGCSDNSSERYTRVEGSQLKMMRHYPNNTAESLINDICKTLVDQANRHPECKTYELKAFVIGYNTYGNTATNEVVFSGDDLDEIRKYKDAITYQQVAGPWIRGELQSSGINRGK